MIEILKSFEQVAQRFSPIVLVLPGLEMIVLGLVAWLGGMCFRRLMPALFGAGSGAVVSLLAGVRNPPLVAAAAGGTAAAGAMQPRVFLAVLLAGLTVGGSITVGAGRHLSVRQGTLFGKPDVGQGEERLTVQESLDAVQAYGLDVRDRLGASVRTLGLVPWALIAAAALAALVIGVFFERPAGAFTCSLLGTLLVFAGLVLLLIFKGAAPIARMEDNRLFYGLVFLGMTAFGTLEQLLVCRPPRRGPHGQAGQSPPSQKQAKHGWRNR